jgi:membrane protein YdbS with pleckstrin-like domain
MKKDDLTLENSDKSGNSKKITANGDSAIIIAIAIGICIYGFVAYKTNSKLFASMFIPVMIVIAVVGVIAVSTNNDSTDDAQIQS